jgi:Ca-activated chloride channel family protein
MHSIRLLRLDGKRARRPAQALVLAAACVFAAGPAFAADEAPEQSNVLIILDSSGSMAGKLGGEPKMQIAQRTVRDLVANMPSDMTVGLLVYGSQSPREKKDCSDIQLLQPVGPVDVAVFDARLAQLKPRGMTPIGASLQRGAEALKGLPGKSTIVLVSDGTETCESDPCKIANEVRTQTGIDVKVHVVGLDVGSGERGTLECVAEGGGGKYYAAGNEEELKAALSEATAPPPRACNGSRAMWMSIAHPGLGEMTLKQEGFKGAPPRKFWLGFIPGFGWPGYLQVVSAIDAKNCKTNDWPE